MGEWEQPEINDIYFNTTNRRVDYLKKMKSSKKLYSFIYLYLIYLSCCHGAFKYNVFFVYALILFI